MNNLKDKTILVTGSAGFIGFHTAKTLLEQGVKIIGLDNLNNYYDPSLKEARNKISQNSVSDKIKLVQSDIRALPKFRETFDAAIMMFNIAGYQHTVDDMAMVARGVSSYISAGGIFLFDAWNGPAVVADPPTDRTKVIEKPDGTKLTRITRGSLDKDNKLVKIRFEVTEEKNGEKKESVAEDHPMRYWEIQELQSALSEGGLELIKTTSFIDLEKPVSNTAWDMQVIAKKV